MILQLLTLHITVRHWQLYLLACVTVMGCEGAYVTTQAVLTMQ